MQVSERERRKKLVPLRIRDLKHGDSLSVRQGKSFFSLAPSNPESTRLRRAHSAVMKYKGPNIR